MNLKIARKQIFLELLYWIFSEKKNVYVPGIKHKNSQQGLSAGRIHIKKKLVLQISFFQVWGISGFFFSKSLHTAYQIDRVLGEKIT
jgi:hypothetical protein